MSEGGLRERVEAVRVAIREACVRGGRSEHDVQLLAASKKKSPEAIEEAYACGLDLFGESRVQEARQKIPLCPGRIAWHFIGHLQTNKAREAVSLFECIHSADSLRLLQALDACADEEGRRMRAFLEINVAGEGSKTGVPPDAAPGVLEAARGLARVEIVGLMAIPPFTPKAEGARPHFAALRVLRDRLRAQTGYALEQLSMGMSHDYPVAIEEGSTCVRIGRALFGER